MRVDFRSNIEWLQGCGKVGGSGLGRLLMLVVLADSGLLARTMR